eukprot:4654481-Pleurochrysis_carterae.AAC.1
MRATLRLVRRPPRRLGAPYAVRARVWPHACCASRAPASRAPVRSPSRAVPGAPRIAGTCAPSPRTRRVCARTQSARACRPCANALAARARSACARGRQARDRPCACALYAHAH